MANYSIVLPESLVHSLFINKNRDCHYWDIIDKVVKVYPNLSDYAISDLKDYVERLHIDATEKFERENVEYFRHTSFKDFEYVCQNLVDDVCVNKFVRDEMYEFAVESDAFMDAFYAQHDINVDFGGDDFDDFDCDSDMSYSEQCQADRNDYASQFSDPIQRAEIRAGA